MADASDYAIGGITTQAETVVHEKGKETVS